ncbi:hypothetical protein GGR56DRAFT_673307 [Xylariaceae sp. FL0804]|nr:hypothetical protein GGR56DRAFT_673307 [Xylariaceae sp. FL0804]
MQLYKIVIATAALLPAALAARQPVVAYSTGPIQVGSLGPGHPAPSSANYTVNTITQPPNPVATAAPEKPALEASVMGLVVFSVAGLCLL